MRQLKCFSDRIHGAYFFLKREIIQFASSHPISLRPRSVYLLSLSRTSKFSLPFRFYDKFCFHFWTVMCTTYISLSSYPPLFDRPNNIWWRAQVTKLLTVQFSWTSFSLKGIVSSLLTDNLCFFIPCKIKFYTCTHQ